MPFLSADDPLLDDGEFTSSLVYGLAKPRLAYPYMYDDFFDVGFLNNIDSYHITYDDLEGLDRRVIPAQNYDFINYVANHKKYSSIQSALSEIGDNPEMSDIELLNIGRKCKAALVWASESGVRVHFILDDIDMDEVVRKLPNTRPPLGSATPTTSITSRELRFLYRNRNNEKISSNVRFWKEGKQVPAPWETDSTTWKRYKPKSEIIDAQTTTKAALEIQPTATNPAAAATATTEEVTTMEELGLEILG